VAAAGATLGVLMSLDELRSARFGPSRRRIAPEKVAEFVAATGDDPERWTIAAPPSYAGGLLFVAAAAFLSSPEVTAHTKVLVHTDQEFRWHGPLPIGHRVEITGTVAEVRQRGPVSFVTFTTTVVGDGGAILLEADSRFLMGAEPADPPAREWTEPAVGDRAADERPQRYPMPGPGGDLPSLAKSASRIDLVRYAGASGDFNPIHFDHAAAVGAGMPGVVVHGLLMAAWVAQLAAAGGAERFSPLQDLRLRFRAPLPPGAAAVVGGVVEDRDEERATVKVAIHHRDEALVTGRATVRMG
jgi:acyl dehydratase